MARMPPGWRRLAPHAPTHVAGLGGPSGGEREHRLDDREDQPERDDDEQRQPAVAGQHRAEAVAGDGPAGLEVGPALEHGFAVPDPRRGGHEHASAHLVRAPRQVEVLAVEVDAGVEALEVGEEVGADEGEAAGHGEHVAHRVVLLLVELAALGVRGVATGAVDGEAHLEQHRRGRPSRRAWARRCRRSSGTPPRRAGGWHRGRGRRRRGRSRRRWRPRPGSAPR